ncbi:5-formyltetrahydrofolate cyclo-ligase [Phaeovibrio sulfidiphilus]|uniref:5-formyltetrahydrofolate cyclo-ligase n=2 Tax=Phaeovibrio sulfidiphilus TaxID=1220600 RepID=A0A8J6YNC2_9PROT|nr:5-formyltetrahydrofolate cyclo-ligase [Phaeovibrio sulfidiphilus]MBE1236067.1 5-formyltetrahydrofolate cyclo-ligase [Phaeovibrio sulfidiphilus]
MDKTGLRRLLRARRRTFCADHGEAAARALVPFALERFAPQGAGAVVAGYWPIPGEVDPRPLMRALEDRGYRLALPVIRDPGSSLGFRAWTFGDILEAGPCGALEPPATAQAVVPDHVLVPLLGFDRTGGRLGQGGGYYDRTLEALAGAGGQEVRTLGLAFSCQQVEGLPMEPHDRRLEAVATECGLFDCGETFLKAGAE